uniref:Uncharacterized protein n=1 Tax=Arundo donax TaxID=35708 RepID=A0A0A9HTA1_ARUDO
MYASVILNDVLMHTEEITLGLMSNAMLNSDLKIKSPDDRVAIHFNAE